MEFSELKQIVIDNVKKAEICPKFQQLIKATNYAEMIAAGIDIGVDITIWCYQSGILTDDLLSEIPESDLNSAGIYTTGTFNLSNPTGNVYILKDAIATISIDGDNSCNLYSMGAAVITLNISGNAYCELKSYNTASNTINLLDDASMIITGLNESNNIVTSGGNSVVHMTSTGDSTNSYTGNDNSYANIKSFINAEVNVSLNGSASIDYSSSGNSSVIIPTDPIVCNYSIQDLQATSIDSDTITSGVKLTWKNSPSNADSNNYRMKLSSSTDWGYPAQLSKDSYYDAATDSWSVIIQNVPQGLSYDYKIAAICTDGSEIGESIISFTKSNT